MKVGFIGLGAIGWPMVQRLLAAGHRVTVVSRSRPPVDRAVAAGAVDGGDPAGVVEASEVTILCVPLGPDVASVVEQLLPALAPGKIVVDCSTIDPEVERAQHVRVARAGADYLEAPLSGGPGIAAEGRLAVMVGGDAAVLERARPALVPFARLIVHVGGPGAGQSVKLCNNLIHAAQMLATAEACALVARAGIDVARFHQVVLHSTGDCTAMRQRVPVEGVVPDSPASNGWRGFPTEFMVKEMDMVLAFAARHGMPLASTAVVRELFVRTAEAGYGQEDFSAVGKLLRDSHRHPEARAWLEGVCRSVLGRWPPAEAGGPTE